MVMVDKEKMSKSLNNFFTIRDVLGYYDPETVRYFLLSAHYRSQLNYTEENPETGAYCSGAFHTALRGTDKDAAVVVNEESANRFAMRWMMILTHRKLTLVLFDMARELNRLKQEDMIKSKWLRQHNPRQLAGVLGLLTQIRSSSCSGYAERK